MLNIKYRDQAAEFERRLVPALLTRVPVISRRRTTPSAVAHVESDSISVKTLRVKNCCAPITLNRSLLRRAIAISVVGQSCMLAAISVGLVQKAAKWESTMQRDE